MRTRHWQFRKKQNCGNTPLDRPLKVFVMLTVFVVTLNSQEEKVL